MSFGVSGALLDACVLGILRQGATYGYDLTQKMNTRMQVSETTLYPVLRRLLKDGSLSSYDEPTEGRMRRYYALTPAGETQLEQLQTEWENYRSIIDTLLGGTL